MTDLHFLDDRTKFRFVKLAQEYYCLQYSIENRRWWPVCDPNPDLPGLIRDIRDTLSGDVHIEEILYVEDLDALNPIPIDKIQGGMSIMTLQGDTATIIDSPPFAYRMVLIESPAYDIDGIIAFGDILLVESLPGIWLPVHKDAGYVEDMYALLNATSVYYDEEVEDDS